MKKRAITAIGVIFAVLVCAMFSTVIAAKTDITNNVDETVSNNTITANTLNSYIDTVKDNNLKFVETKAPDVKVTITFSKSMSYKDLVTFIDAYNVNAVQLQARGYDKENKRITFFSKTDLGMENTFYMLENMGINDNVAFSGIIAMYAYINAEQILDVQANKNVLLLDTSSDSRYQQIASNDISDLGNRQEEYTNKEFTNSIAWDAEDAGLVYY